MNNKSSGFGCLLLVIAVIIGAIVQFLGSVPGIILILITITAVIASIRSSRKENLKKLWAAMEDHATTLDKMAGEGLGEFNVAASLNKGENVLYVEQGVGLTEYQSTGSTYSGTSAGISFPIVGRIRGNVGGHSGQVIKNPEELMEVDKGQAIFTNQRILFIGAKFVRDWDFSKIVSIQPGPNGHDVSIAVSTRERTSGLQAPNYFVFGPGYPAAYAYTWFKNGEADAKRWATETAGELRTAVEKTRAESTQPK